MTLAGLLCKHVDCHDNHSNDLTHLNPSLSPSLPNTSQLREDDTSLFDTKFTDQPPVDSPVDSKISASADQNFSGFTYVAPSVLEEIHKINCQRAGQAEESRVRGPR